ncbi:MAG TPA: hypothetical protein VIH57_06160 [Bacteroidales bacterium]
MIALISFLIYKCRDNYSRHLFHDLTNQTIVKHTFGENDHVWLSNTGTTQLKFYLANAKGAQPGDTFITLATGEQIVLASALGELTNTYLTVLNTDPLHDGAFGVELV